MGIDLDLAVSQVDDEFVCVICQDILVNPVEIKGCEHIFCEECIRGSLQLNRNCPLDRNPVQESDLGQPRRYFRNMLANLILRCEFCSSETIHGDFERHKNNCPQNTVECTFCSVEYIVNEEALHQNICVPFLQQKIETLELKNETEKKNFEKQIERMAKNASERRNSPYILTWKAKFPTPQDHQQNGVDYFYTASNNAGNLVDGTRKTNPRFKLDHGEMQVCLLLDKETDEREICIHFFLPSGKKGRVKFNYSLSVAGKVLWQKERTEELEVESNAKDGWTGGEINDVLPSDLPSNLLVTVEVIEWEPNRNFEAENKNFEAEKKNFEAEKKNFEAEKKNLESQIERLSKSASESRKSPYILTWKAKFPTSKNYTLKTDNYYYTWNNHVGKLVNRTFKKNPKFTLDHGEMSVGLRLRKGTDERCICIQFYLTTIKKARVKFNLSFSSNGKVLWQKEKTEELEVESNSKTGFTGGHINDVLPSDLPPNLLVTVEVIEWEPNKNLEAEKKKIEAIFENLESEIERLSKSASESRKSPYILTWNAKFPTPQNHTLMTYNYYYTWNNHVGNLVNRTLKKNPKFKLDHGEMTVGLCLNKETDERCICIQFFLTTGKKGRVKFNASLSRNRMVLWQKEITEELEVINNDRLGWTGGHINYVLPSDIPNLLPNLLVTVEVIEWEPNNEHKKNFESEKNSAPNNDSRAGPSRQIAPRIYPDFDANFDKTKEKAKF